METPYPNVGDYFYVPLEPVFDNSKSYPAEANGILEPSLQNSGVPELTSPPSFLAQMVSAMGAATKFVEAGAPTLSKEALLDRMEICKGCEWWSPTAFNNTGRCLKCGCSTWAKLQMATESCPIGKWKPIEPSINLS
jgi:hypothetical protein